MGSGRFPYAMTAVTLSTTTHTRACGVNQRVTHSDTNLYTILTTPEPTTTILLQGLLAGDRLVDANTQFNSLTTHTKNVWVWCKWSAY